MKQVDRTHTRPFDASPASQAAAAVARGVVLLLAAGGMIAALSAAVAPVHAQEADARHMLWEISDGEATVGHLLGSVHYMKPEVYPLASAYQRAFDAADVVAFEVDLDSLQAEAPGLFSRLGTFQDETTLQAVIPDSTWTALEARFGSLGLPASQMQGFEPWAVAFTVTALDLQRAGYSPESGIDRHFFDRTKDAGKSIVGLESPAEQMRYFDEMSVDLQAAFLHYSLQDAERTMEQFDEIVAAWEVGDADRLADLVQGELGERFPRLYETIIAERNRKWIPQITALAEGDGMPLIIVGAGHITGPDGLVTLLHEQGYAVEQIETPPVGEDGAEAR